MKLLKRLIREDDGASMVEYGILIAGIAVVVIALVFALGGTIADMFSDIAGKIAGGGS